jgi:hypothetical protein
MNDTRYLGWLGRVSDTISQATSTESDSWCRAKKRIEMIYIHPAYYSHHYENQLISWAVALFGSTTLLTVATNFTNTFFRQAGFVELAEVCKEGTRLGPEKNEKADFVAHLMLYRPPELALRRTTGCHDEEPTAPGRNQPEDGVKRPAAEPLGGNDPEAPHSGRGQAGPGPIRNQPNLSSSKSETPSLGGGEATVREESP